MRSLGCAVLMLIVSVFFLTGCAALSLRRDAVPVQARYEPDSPTWAERYLPGVKWLANLLPPPTEARIKWDEHLQRHHPKSPENPSFKGNTW